MKALIDADIFLYEVGAVGEYVDENTGEKVYRSFDWVAEKLHNSIDFICESVGATEPPTLYLTGTKQYWGENFKPNFREELAKERAYKGNRKKDKPFHYFNIYNYIPSAFDTVISNGCEADDLICIEQYTRWNCNVGPEPSIICTRDKDLRMCPGWHYGWECGKQPEFGPHYYEPLGEIELVRKKSGNKIVGGGMKFFFSQLLTGDVVDNIAGLKKAGPVKAFNMLGDLETEEEMMETVCRSYAEQLGEGWQDLLQEQIDLLWIRREVDKNGELVGYEFDRNRYSHF